VTHMTRGDDDDAVMIRGVPPLAGESDAHDL
jgi:hypothetical protein